MKLGWGATRIRPIHFPIFNRKTRCLLLPTASDFRRSPKFLCVPYKTV